MEFREFYEQQEKMDESLWGLAKGGWNTFAGAMTMGDEAIAKMVGSGTRGRFRSGGRQFARGLRQILIGDPPKDPPPRQIEIPREQPKPRQEQPKPRQEQPKPRQEQPKPRQEQPKPRQEQPKPRQEQPKPRQEQPKPRQEQPSDRPLMPGEPQPNAKWLELSKYYRNAREAGNRAVMNHIEFLMSQADPIYYDYAIKQARLRKGSRKS